MGAEISKSQLGDVTFLLRSWSDGDPAAGDRLVEIVYPQLRRLVVHRMVSEHRPSLQATEVVHELYLRLLDQSRVRWQDRSHFFAVAARLLRRILVDHIRHRQRAKRGGGWRRADLEDVQIGIDGHSVDLLALDQALRRLARIDATAEQVVELRYFAGLSHDETAQVLGIGRATVGRNWRFARAWLRQQLTAAEAGEAGGLD